MHTSPPLVAADALITVDTEKVADMTLHLAASGVDARRAATTSRFTHQGIAFGCDYNPEQWSPETWREDVRLMRQAGVDLVGVNIFGWAEIQRPDGSFDFARLDEVIALLDDAGIAVNLGTGTSSPPPWLTTRHPEILPVVEDGTTRFPGGRQAWCPSSPVFRAAALEVVDAVAERYGRHDAVELWHVSNELGCHNAYCHCEESTRSFRRWLERRYGDVEALNAAWGTSFWSQRYTDWSEIHTPRATLSTRNPSQLLDYRRFSSDALLEHYRAEAEVIRRHSEKPVTTNFMVTAHIDALDYATWTGDMDVIANDHYLDHRLGDPHGELSFSADLVRGLAGGDPWLLMEHSTGAVNWQPVNPAKTPGQMMRDTLVHVARGADAACFFQWRASLQGSEKFHSALVGHAGTDSAQWREVQELGRVIGALAEVQGSRVVADAAVLFSWPSWWATDAENTPSSAVGYLDQVHAAHRALRDAGITADVVDPETDLRGYRLIVVPGLHVVTDAAARRLDEAVAAGSHTLVTFFSGIVDENDRVRPGGYPAPWRDLLGIRVEEFAPALPSTPLRLESGRHARLWAERLVARDAQVIDRFADGPAAGMPALTRRAGRAGAGDAWYLATMLEPTDYTALIAQVSDAAGLEPEQGASRDVEVVRRRSEDGTTWRFVVNHASESVTVDVHGTDLVTGRAADGSAVVAPGAVGVFREEER